jgi:hypothetical protein
VATIVADTYSIEKVAARILAIKKDSTPKLQLRELVTEMSLPLITLQNPISCPPTPDPTYF